MNRDLILKVIESFYATAKTDFMIGYHFRFIESFEEHIPRIAEFWNLQLNQQISDRDLLPFKLIEVHKPLGIKRGEIGRWVVLFQENLDKFPEVTPDQKQIWMEKVEHFKIKIIEKLIQP